MAIALGILSGLLALSLVVNVMLWREERRSFRHYLEAERDLAALLQAQPVDLLVGERGKAVVRTWMN